MTDKELTELLEAYDADRQAWIDGRLCVLCEQAIVDEQTALFKVDEEDEDEYIVHERCLRQFNGLSASLEVGDENPQN